MSPDQPQYVPEDYGTQIEFEAGVELRRAGGWELLAVQHVEGQPYRAHYGRKRERSDLRGQRLR